MRRRTLAACFMLGLCAPLAARAHAPTALVSRSSVSAREYAALLRTAGRLPLLARIEFVNAVVNQRIGYASDASTAGLTDHWQTPVETLASEQGDCEDFAILKYFALRDCAQPCACSRLLYAWRSPPDAPDARLPHVALLGGVSLADPLVLDNVTPHALPLAHRTDLHPVLSFDVEHLWRGASAQRVGDAAALLKPWRELLGRWALQR